MPHRYMMCRKIVQHTLLRSLLLSHLMTLRLIPFNTLGFRRLEKQIELVHMAHATGCDLLFLQETNFSSQPDMDEFEEGFF